MYKDQRQVDATRGRWQAMRMEVENLQTGHRSEIVFDKFAANVGVQDQEFTVRALER
jgi:hypothetical protein